MRKSITKLAHALREKELTVAFAESMTCGLAAHQLALVKGTSDILQGSIVCYHPSVKTSLLKVSRALIDRHSPESEEVTRALAKNLPNVVRADIHASVTGLASAGGSETASKPVGTVFLAVFYNGKMKSEKKLFRGTPVVIRKKACEALYTLMLKVVKTTPGHK